MDFYNNIAIKRDKERQIALSVWSCVLISPLFARWKLTKDPKLVCIVLPLLTPQPPPPYPPSLLCWCSCHLPLAISHELMNSKAAQIAPRQRGITVTCKIVITSALTSPVGTRGLQSGAAYLCVRYHVYTPAAYNSGRLIIRRLR